MEERRRPHSENPVSQAESILSGYKLPSLLALRRNTAIANAEITSDPNHTLAAGDEIISTMIAITMKITNPPARVEKNPVMGLFQQCFPRFILGNYTDSL
jgi:hypothetical protein